MAVTYLVVAYGGSYYGQIPYAMTDIDSLGVAASFTASYTPRIDKAASYITRIDKAGRVG